MSEASILYAKFTSPCLPSLCRKISPCAACSPGCCTLGPSVLRIEKHSKRIRVGMYDLYVQKVITPQSDKEERFLHQVTPQSTRKLPSTKGTGGTMHIVATSLSFLLLTTALYSTRMDIFVLRTQPFADFVSRLDKAISYICSQDYLLLPIQAPELNPAQLSYFCYHKLICYLGVDC